MTAQDYLSSHGITEDTIKKFTLTHDDNELHIPITDENGTILFYKHRNLQYDKNSQLTNKYRYDPGSSAALFNLRSINDKSFMVISEGEVDAMRLDQEAIPSVTSTGGALKFDPSWITHFENKVVFICLDNDKAGIEGTKKLFELLPEAKAVVLPEDIKDVCDYFQTNKTKKDYIQLLKTALTKTEWLQLHEPEEFDWINAKQLSEMDFPEEEWLIDRVVYKEGFCFIYGAEGVGKSFVTLSMAQAIADGKDWLGQFKVPKPAKVLFIDKENPKPMLSKRIKNMGIFNENMFWLKYPEKMQLADNKGEVSEFAKAVANKVNNQEIDVIIIDSFVDLMVGSENSASDTQVFFDTLRTLIPSKAFVVLHHENKPSQGVFRSDSQRARGSTNINAQTVTQFRLEAVAKSKTELTLKQTKARDAQKLDKFMIQMVVETEGDKTKVIGFKYIGIVTGEADENKTEEAKSTIIEAVGNELNMSRSQIIEACGSRGISEKTVQRVLKQMVEDKTLEEIRDGRTKSYILLTVVEGENED
jgi:archaellum biogenesis ATPase FlaH/5S rRNA maturation endonuclease (ribonuclease M5)